MKNYFAKYLPVEGEIKKGDTMLSFLGSGGLLPTISIYDGENHIGKDDTKVKLFLCSRDIRVGEEVYYGDNPNAPKHTCESIQECQANKCWKVIGEISPEATWVKEGDEFDDTEVGILMEDNSIKPIRSFIGPQYTIGILGPCGRFH